MARFASQSQVDLVVQTRLSVLTVMGGAAGTLLAAGMPPAQTAATVVAGTFGGVRVGCQLTLPYVAPKTVVSVLILVLLVLITAIGQGYSAPVCLAVVLTGAWSAAEVARRIAALVLRPSGVVA